MKKTVIFILYTFLILFCATLLFAADNVAVETKDAIIRDVKAIKDQVPNDIEEAKKELINISNEVKTSVTQEAKDIHEGLSKPFKPAKSETKTN